MHNGGVLAVDNRIVDVPTLRIIRDDMVDMDCAQSPNRDGMITPGTMYWSVFRCLFRPVGCFLFKLNSHFDRVRRHMNTNVGSFRICARLLSTESPA